MICGSLGDIPEALSVRRPDPHAAKDSTQETERSDEFLDETGDRRLPERNARPSEDHPVMNRTIRVAALFGSGTVLLSFVVLVVNQTAQVVQLTTAISPTLGTVTLWTLLGTYAALIGAPVVMIARLPRPLTPPENAEGPDFETHLKRLGERLATSPHLKGTDLSLSRREGIEEALRVLAARTDEIVRQTAASVFISTAVSQSGRLDGLIVMAAQSRMVWRVAHVYYQRPTVRDMIHLYANVAGTAFIASELQEIDLGEQVEPVLGAALSALGAGLPGLQVAGSLLASCVLDGSANAFLTLRVGMIAKRHCGALVVQRKAEVRRAATSEAAQYLGGIVADGSARISKALWRASVDKVGDAVSGFSGKAKDAGAKFLARVRNNRPREQPEMG
jgi:hypothetical protein